MPLINKEFSEVRTYLEGHKKVDAVTGGDSPVTVRFITKRNVYVNVGLERVDDTTCEVKHNLNSYNGLDSDLEELASIINKMPGDDTPVPPKKVNGTDVRTAST